MYNERNRKIYIIGTTLGYLLGEEYASNKESPCCWK